MSQLGHGPETDRCLELVARRDWRDDRALFGKWDPRREIWEPSSDGFLELLLVAHDDEACGFGGLYTGLFEEMNLAQPEHYLARLMGNAGGSESTGASVRGRTAAVQSRAVSSRGADRVQRPACRDHQQRFVHGAAHREVSVQGARDLDGGAH